MKDPHRVTLKSDVRVQTAVPRSGVWYARDARVDVSGVRFSRDTKTLFGVADGARTLALPSTVRTVRGGAFRGATSLRSVALNEGLPALWRRKWLTEKRSRETFLPRAALRV